MKNRIIGFYQYDDNGKKAYCVAEDNNGAVELRKVENDDEALKDLQRFCRYQRINNDNLEDFLKSSKFGTNLTSEDLGKRLIHEFGNKIHQNDVSNFLNNRVPVPGSSDEEDDEYDYDDQDDENLSLREKVRNKFDSLRQSYLDYRRDRKTKKAAKKAEKEAKEGKKKLSTRGKITIAVATVAALAITGLITSLSLNKNNAYIPSNTNRNNTSQSSTPEPDLVTPTEEVVTTPNTVTQESSATSTYTNQEMTNHTATTVTTPTTSTDSTANMPAPQDSDPNNFNTNKQEAIDSLNRDEPITDPEVHIYDEYIEEDGSLVDYITGVTTDDTGLNEELPDPNAEEETKEDSDLADVIIEEAPYANDQAVQSNEEQTVESEAYSSSQQFAVTSDVYVNEQDRATYVIDDDGNGYVYLDGEIISIVPVVQETENSTSLQYVK